MKQNVTYNIGSIALIDKLNVQFGLFDFLFDSGFGRARKVKETAKLLVANRLDKCVSVHRLPSIFPQEFFETLGFGDAPAERNIYRNVERIGQRFNVLVEQYQRLAVKNNLVSAEQFLDFSSAYFEGTKSELGALGYSRDNQPGKRQITFGVSTGINEVPSALTVQKGNMQDKKHMRILLPTVQKVLPLNSLLIFDCGANTKANKKQIRARGFHYLTLKPKKRSVYKRFLHLFKNSEPQKILINGLQYECVKVQEGEEVNYVFFSKKLEQEQLRKKKQKFLRELDRNDVVLSKVKRGKDLQTLVSKQGYIVTQGRLQKALEDIPNPFVTNLEGFFVLEASIDAEPAKILLLYKDKDKAEKLIRNMKEGTELRPIRHWSKFAVLGYLFIVFLTNVITSLTQFLSQNCVVKNLKLLKKYLQNLTLTVIYPKKAFRVALLSNISPVTEALLGDFIYKYGITSPDLRW
jgi:transposase